MGILNKIGEFLGLREDSLHTVTGDVVDTSQLSNNDYNVLNAQIQGLYSDLGATDAVDIKFEKIDTPGIGVTYDKNGIFKDDVINRLSGIEGLDGNYKLSISKPLPQSDNLTQDDINRYYATEVKRSDKNYSVEEGNEMVQKLSDLYTLQTFTDEDGKPYYTKDEALKIINDNTAEKKQLEDRHIAKKVLGTFIGPTSIIDGVDKGITDLLQSSGTSITGLTNDGIEKIGFGRIQLFDNWKENFQRKSFEDGLSQTLSSAIGEGLGNVVSFGGVSGLSRAGGGLLLKGLGGSQKVGQAVGGGTAFGGLITAPSFDQRIYTPIQNGQSTQGAGFIIDNAGGVLGKFVRGNRLPQISAYINKNPIKAATLESGIFESANFIVTPGMTLNDAIGGFIAGVGVDAVLNSNYNSPITQRRVQEMTESLEVELLSGVDIETAGKNLDNNGFGKVGGRKVTQIINDFKVGKGNIHTNDAISALLGKLITPEAIKAGEIGESFKSLKVTNTLKTELQRFLNSSSKTLHAETLYNKIRESVSGKTAKDDVDSFFVENIAKLDGKIKELGGDKIQAEYNDLKDIKKSLRTAEQQKTFKELQPINSKLNKFTKQKKDFELLLDGGASDKSVDSVHKIVKGTGVSEVLQLLNQDNIDDVTSSINESIGKESYASELQKAKDTGSVDKYIVANRNLYKEEKSNVGGESVSTFKHRFTDSDPVTLKSQDIKSLEGANLKDVVSQVTKQGNKINNLITQGINTLLVGKTIKDLSKKELQSQYKAYFKRLSNVFINKKIAEIPNGLIPKRKIKSIAKGFYSKDIDNIEDFYAFTHALDSEIHHTIQKLAGPIAKNIVKGLKERGKNVSNRFDQKVRAFKKKRFDILKKIKRVSDDEDAISTELMAEFTDTYDALQNAPTPETAAQLLNIMQNIDDKINLYKKISYNGKQDLINQADELFNDIDVVGDLDISDATKDAGFIGTTKVFLAENANAPVRFLAYGLKKVFMKIQDIERKNSKNYQRDNIINTGILAELHKNNMEWEDFAMYKLIEQSRREFNHKGEPIYDFGNDFVRDDDGNITGTKNNIFIDNDGNIFQAEGNDIQDLNQALALGYQLADNSKLDSFYEKFNQVRAKDRSQLNKFMEMRDNFYADEVGFPFANLLFKLDDKRIPNIRKGNYPIFFKKDRDIEDALKVEGGDVNKKALNLDEGAMTNRKGNKNSKQYFVNLSLGAYQSSVQRQIKHGSFGEMLNFIGPSVVKKIKAKYGENTKAGVFLDGYLHSLGKEINKPRGNATQRMTSAFASLAYVKYLGFQITQIFMPMVTILTMGIVRPRAVWNALLSSTTDINSNVLNRDFHTMRSKAATAFSTNIDQYQGGALKNAFEKILSTSLFLSAFGDINVSTFLLKGIITTAGKDHFKRYGIQYSRKKLESLLNNGTLDGIPEADAQTLRYNIISEADMDATIFTQPLSIINLNEFKKKEPALGHITNILRSTVIGETFNTIYSLKWANRNAGFVRKNMVIGLIAYTSVMIAGFSSEEISKWFNRAVTKLANDLKKEKLKDIKIENHKFAEQESIAWNFYNYITGSRTAKQAKQDLAIFKKALLRKTFTIPASSFPVFGSVLVPFSDTTSVTKTIDTASFIIEEDLTLSEKINQIKPSLTKSFGKVFSPIAKIQEQEAKTHRDYIRENNEREYAGKPKINYPDFIEQQIEHAIKKEVDEKFNTASVEVYNKAKSGSNFKSDMIVDFMKLYPEQDEKKLAKTMTSFMAKNYLLPLDERYNLIPGTEELEAYILFSQAAGKKDTTIEKELDLYQNPDKKLPTDSEVFYKTHIKGLADDEAYWVIQFALDDNSISKATAEKHWNYGAKVWFK